MQESDYSKRDYLLPEGCKDLIDALKLKKQEEVPGPSAANRPASFLWEGKTPWPVIGEVIIPEPISVNDLAVLLAQKPGRLIVDLLELNIFANVNQTLDFEMAAALARKYGFRAKR